AFFGVSGVFAFDIDGKFLWQADVGSSTHTFGSSASPIIYKGLLIVNASIESKQIFAFDKLNGQVKWIRDRVEQSWPTPSVGVSAEDRVELIVSRKFFVYGLDPLTGEEYWTCDGIQDYVVPRPVIYGDMAYVSGGKESRLMGIRLGGTGDVTKANKLWESRLIDNVPTPVFLDGKIFVVGESGILQTFSADTGELLKKTRVKTKQLVMAGMVKSRDHFFASTPGLGVTIIDQTEPYKVLISNRVDPDAAPVRSDCSIAGDQLFYRTDDWIYCVGQHQNPPDENKVQIDQQSEVIVAKPKPDLDEAQKVKTYVRYMSGNKEETVALVLRPYDSIITPGEEREKLNQLVGSHWDQYVAIRADHRRALMQQNLIPDEEYVAKFAAIGQRMMALDKLVRSKVRPTFSKEQMAQHKAEHAEWLRKQAEKKKAAE
ncbi:PQQ-like beta-propeller repeat protein, partial [Mariniblastus sp.]|nr:PQQ-like beta-propeller repeat protein [Mariniblastus sp.]